MKARLIVVGLVCVVGLGGCTFMQAGMRYAGEVHQFAGKQLVILSNDEKVWGSKSHEDGGVKAKAEASPQK